MDKLECQLEVAKRQKMVFNIAEIGLMLIARGVEDPQMFSFDLLDTISQIKKGTYRASTKCSSCAGCAAGGTDKCGHLQGGMDRVSRTSLGEGT